MAKNKNKNKNRPAAAVKEGPSPVEAPLPLEQPLAGEGEAPKVPEDQSAGTDAPAPSETPEDAEAGEDPAPPPAAPEPLQSPQPPQPDPAKVAAAKAREDRIAWLNGKIEAFTRAINVTIEDLRARREALDTHVGREQKEISHLATQKTRQFNERRRFEVERDALVAKR